MKRVFHPRQTGLPPNNGMAGAGPVPDGWNVVNLGQVCSIQTGFPFQSDKFVDRSVPDAIPLIRIRDVLCSLTEACFKGPVDSKILSEFTVSSGETLIGMDGNFHVAQWKGKPALLNQRVARLRKFSDRALGDFIHYAIQKPIQTIEHSKHFTTVKHLSIGDLRGLPIPLPPLGEQRRIARVLSTIQRAIEAQEKVITSAKELKRSLMKHLFTYGPVPLSETARVPQKETEIGLIPEHWELVPFEHCILKGKKIFSVGKVNQEEFKLVGRYPVVDQGQGFIAGYSDCEDKSYQGPLPVVLFGDHTRIVKYVDFPFICGADGVKVLPPNREKVLPKFLFYAVSRLALLSRGYNRHYRLLREQKLPVPPKPEQEEVLTILSELESKTEAEEKRKAALQALFKTMLHHLMTGKIRVTSTVTSDE